MRQYEKCIDSLMEQVAVLKQEVDKSRKQPNASCDEPVESSGLNRAPVHERLLKQFDEIDGCCEAVARQMNAMCCALQQRQKDERRGVDPGVISSALSNHRQQLLDRMCALDTSCRRLKQLLR